MRAVSSLFGLSAAIMTMIMTMTTATTNGNANAIANVNVDIDMKMLLRQPRPRTHQNQRRELSISEECQQETNELWAEADELNINVGLPDVSDMSILDYCNINVDNGSDGDIDNDNDNDNDTNTGTFVCDLSEVESNVSIASMCDQLGGQVVPLTINFGYQCLGNAFGGIDDGGDSEIGSDTAIQFINLNVCGGAVCTRGEIQAVTQTFLYTMLSDGIGNGNGNGNGNSCPIQVESAAYSQRQGMPSTFYIRAFWTMLTVAWVLL